MAKHVIEPFKGAKSRELPANLKPVGTGPYRIVDFKPGDSVKAELNPNYHVPNRPFFDTLEMKGGGDAASAARAVIQTGEYDYAWNMQVEDDILLRLEQGGRGKVEIVYGGNIEFIGVNFSDPWTEVDGEWCQPEVQAPVPQRSRRPPGVEPPGRPVGRPGADLRPPGPHQRQLPERALQVPLRAT